jgi:hypothetical protein
MLDAKNINIAMLQAGLYFAKLTNMKTNEVLDLKKFVKE